jgi:hypothetical protein
MRRTKLLLGVLLSLGILVLLLVLSPGGDCLAQADCHEPAATGRQPFPTELAGSFERAGMNELGPDGPVLPKVFEGYPTAVPVTPYVPCIILKAVAQTESGGWKQYRAAYDENGETVISFDYGYGIMQITSGMSSCDPITSFDPSLVARSTKYNIGTGALFLINKWNKAPYIGTNDPQVAEEWYYAVWMYNGWSNVNNPSYNCPIDNPECSFANNPLRPPFTAAPGQKRSWYPYQELVWGYAANPPVLNGAPAWQAVPLTLPDRTLITLPPPAYIPRPVPFHFSCGVTVSNTYLPLVAEQAVAPTPIPTPTPLP